MAIRSGRVSFTVPASGVATATLVSGGAGAIYRVFNSGGRGAGARPRKFTIKSNGNDLYEGLYPTLSVDVGVERGLSIESGSNDQEIKCSYDLLRGADNVLSKVDGRSGRFNIPAAIPNPTAFFPHKIVDLTHSPETAYYRIFNPGDKNITIILAKQDGSGPVSTTLLPLQSQDFEISHALKRCLFVNREADTERIEGIYELVGCGA